jgi:RimJ/RimL family protein N-acetyltransferase
MMVSRSHDHKDIKRVVMSMLSDVTEDDTAPECANIDVDTDCWLSLGECGYMHVSAYNRTTLDIHPYIIKEQRNKSIECGKATLKWVAENAPSMYKKIISQVPSIYPHIKRYTKRLGFEHEGTYKKCFTKNGQLYDLWLFGIERKDI